MPNQQLEKADGCSLTAQGLSLARKKLRLLPLPLFVLRKGFEKTCLE